MSKARSPRLVCSITIGTSGLTIGSSPFGARPLAFTEASQLLVLIGLRSLCSFCRFRGLRNLLRLARFAALRGLAGRLFARRLGGGGVGGLGAHRGGVLDEKVDRLGD